jgi:hypothetical protein
MPGPTSTLSRCAPAITTLSVRPLRVCAMTLRLVVVRISVLGLDVAVWPESGTSALPSAYDT